MSWSKLRFWTKYALSYVVRTVLALFFVFIAWPKYGPLSPSVSRSLDQILLRPKLFPIGFDTSLRYLSTSPPLSSLSLFFCAWSLSERVILLPTISIPSTLLYKLHKFIRTLATVKENRQFLLILAQRKPWLPLLVVISNEVFKNLQVTELGWNDHTGLVRGVQSPRIDWKGGGR